MPTKVPLPSSALAGVEERTAMRRRLLPFEDRLALLQEGPRPFRVVLAVESLDAHVEELLAMPVVDALEDGLHLRLGAADGERRVLRHRAQVIVGTGLELGGRHGALDESGAQRLQGVQG